MAIRTVREHHITHVCNSLLEIALVDSQWDLHESILEMAVCYDAIIRIHADPMQIFADAAQYATGGGADELRAFPGRSPENRSLAAIGMKQLGAIIRSPIIARGNV